MIEYRHKRKQKREASTVVKFAKRFNSTDNNQQFAQNWLTRAWTGLRHPIRSLKASTRRRRFVTWGLVLLAVVVLGLTSAFIYMRLQATNYDITAFEGVLLDEPIDLYGERLVFDEDREKYVYNDNYLANVDVAGQVFAPKVTAYFHDSPSDGVEVVDPINDVSITLKPLFRSGSPQKNLNRIVYPLAGNRATKIYTLKANSIKEDIILHEYQGNELSFAYELDLPDGTEARLESDGSVGVYGVDSIFLGDIATGSEEDERLVESVRENGERTELLFHLPAPFVIEENKRSSEADAWFTLEDDILTLHADNLDKGNYPLSIDPSVYVESAMQFMRGNNETNVYFDVDYDLIRKAGFTGASFDSWSPTLELNQGVWGAGAVAAGGYVYSVGGNDGTNNISNVYWSRLNTVNYTMMSPNPGDGACTNWCTNENYDLPEALTGLSLVAYNGYLYAIGGEDDSGERSDRVYIAKLGNNGEPRLWHPTSTDESEWVYWYTDADFDLSSERSYHAAVAYENRLYVLGGQTDTDTTGITTVEFVDIQPNGTLSSWSDTGMTPLPPGAGRQHLSAEVYNDRIYVIGGSEGSITTDNIVDSVFYAKLEDGTMSDWEETSSLSSPSMAWGGGFTAVWGGHIYHSGGCAEVIEEDLGEGIEEGAACTDFTQATQFSSINSDGSLAAWHTVSDGDIQRIGHNLVGWNGVLYQVGGCSAQDDSGNCTTIHNESNYAPINQAGDISELSLSSASGSGTCDGAEPYDCHLPPTGNGSGEGGQKLTASTILNGHLYVIGGCIDTDCNNASGNVSYTQVATDGTLAMPESCDGTYYGAWCVDSSNQVNGNQGVAAASITVFNNVIYVVGGTDGNSNTNTIFRNTVESDGSLSGSWISQNLSGGAGVGATSLSHTFAYARAIPGSSSIPGNLYIFGGCSDTSGSECVGGSYEEVVYKCDIGNDGAIDNCDSTGQLQINAASGASDSGLALHGGAVFSDYIYLVGGAAPGQSNLNTVRYAMFDENNDVVAVSGGSWVESTSLLNNEVAGGDSFALNGYLYSVGGYSDSAVLDSMEFSKINPNDGSLDNFATSSTSIDSRWGQSIVVSNSRAYILGGCGSGAGSGSCSQLEETVRTVQIHNNASGSPANYSAADNLFSTDRIAAGSAIYDGYIYIAGGCTDSASCINLTTDVQYAPLDEQGNIGSWSTATADLPADRAWGRLEVAGGTLYYIGGQDGSGNASADIYYAIPSSGDVSNWNIVSNGLPEARTQHSTAVWDDRIYVTGGEDGNGVLQDSVYVSPQLSSGGDITNSWTSSTVFEGARRGHTAAVYANNIYVIGGYDGDNYLSDVQYASINTDGSIGDWASTTSLPMPVQQGDGFAADGYIYLFGGRFGDQEENCLNSTFVAPISANTSEGEGGNPTGLGSWFESASHFGGERFGVSASYHEGKTYVLGGGCAELLNVSELFSSPGLHTFTPPEETTQVIIEAWGGGGGGGQGEAGSGNAAGAGGGGGGYSRHTMPISQGNYDVYVGAGGSSGNDGEGSWFDDLTTAFAAGGGGAGWGPSFGAGGSANIGSDATFDGGDGGTGHDAAQPPLRTGGGGGGSAFFDADGGDGQAGDRGTGGAGGIGTGDGGDGNSGAGTGGSGSIPGAGGGGGGYEGTGGSGATGRVIVFYDEWSELVLSGANRVSVGSLETQPQTANYSYIVDTDTDVFPYAWLMNGTNDTNTLPWRMEYLSSTSVAVTWGQNTDYEVVTFGQPETYVPLDDSGVDTNFARYYYFSVSVDSSTMFGFPYDVSRGATVTDMTLYFTSNPGQRLRHGKTFTGGEQQSFDTPF